MTNYWVNSIFANCKKPIQGKDLYQGYRFYHVKANSIVEYRDKKFHTIIFELEKGDKVACLETGEIIDIGKKD